MLQGEQLILCLRLVGKPARSHLRFPLLTTTQTTDGATMRTTNGLIGTIARLYSKKLKMFTIHKMYRPLSRL